VDHDTAAFAVESIRRPWRWMGRLNYPKAKRLLITADSGEQRCTGAVVEVELQKLVDETGLEISVIRHEVVDRPHCRRHHDRPSGREKHA
jgi:hypothetical protein